MPAAPPRAARLLAPAALLLGVAGCRPDAPPADAAPGPGRRAARARVVLARTDAGPDLPPVRVGDSLLLRVRYVGGCVDPAFSLGADRRRDTLVLRLAHDARGDTCAGEVYDELRLLLPRGAAAHDGPVVLVTPDGEAFDVD